MQNPESTSKNPAASAPKQQFQIGQAFTIPMVAAYMPDCQPLNDELEELFVKRAEQGERYANPEPRVRRNKTLFESRFDLFSWPEPCVQKLSQFCFTNLYRAIAELNGYDNTFLAKMHYSCESWYHLTRRGGYFGAHNHPLHSWSGVYCVRHDGDDPQSDSGKLTFINPNLAGNMYIDVGTAKLKRPYSTAPILLRLEPGQLVLFPSWLLHEVMPYEGDTQRITVAFNVKFRYQGELKL